jgi:hypothetical protein
MEDEPLLAAHMYIKPAHPFVVVLHQRLEHRAQIRHHPENVDSMSVM